MPVIVHAPPGAGHATLALDIPERQVLQAYEDDHFGFHHRLLVTHLGGARWLVCTPTWDVQQVDFADEDIVPLGRAGPFPLAGRPFFAFSPPTEAQLTAMRASAATLAVVLGVVAVPLAATVADTVWLYSDSAKDQFGSEVPVEILAEVDPLLLKGSVGLTWIFENGTRVWTTMERLRAVDRDDWLAEKREGAGRDPRLSSLKEERASHRPLFRQAVESMVSSSPTAALFKGPSAVKEVAQSIVASGLEPVGFHAHWVVASGISPKSGLCLEHLMLVTLMWIMSTVDRLDVFRISGAEHICRRLLQIQRAVKRNPRNPDFEGLDAYLSSALDPSGGVVSPEFDRHVAGLQRDEALIMKQGRLAREEADAEATRAAGGKGPKQTNAAAKGKAKDAA
jgi:hypothetical protein